MGCTIFCLLVFHRELTLYLNARFHCWQEKMKGRMTISEVSAALVERNTYLHWLKMVGRQQQ